MTATKNENSKYTILVVDDNEMNRELMSVQLRRQGYHVELAEGGVQALRMLETNRYDMILLDIMMPDMNGIEVLQEIRKKYSLLHLPIIMVTADDDQARIIEALRHGANDYIVKPLNMAVTAARMKTQLTLKDLAALKDEFVRFASHDLKKPLIVSLDIIDSLKVDCKPGEPTRNDTAELLDLLEKTANNMQEIIAGFLNTESLISGRNAPHYKLLPFNSIVTKSLMANQNYAQQKGITLIDELDPDVPDIEIDEFRISQVLDNLIGNAMKFSPQKTTTVVRTRSDDKYVYAEICDAGPGLTDEDIKKLFAKNSQLSNKPTGNETSTGVGLSISRQLIEQHKGQIGARNNPAQGTTFWFGLPRPQR